MLGNLALRASSIPRMAGVFVRYVLPYGTVGFASAARMSLHAFGILLPANNGAAD